MKYIRQLLILLIMLNAQSVLAVTIVKDNNPAPELVTIFDKTGKVDSVDADGKWIRINNKKYVLRGTGSLKRADLHSGLLIHFNIEKAKGEKNGRVTRIWVK